MTEHARYRFFVKETGNGEPFLVAEPDGPGELKILANGFLALHLRPETSYEEAQTLAEALNDRVDVLSFTDLSRIPT